MRRTKAVTLGEITVTVKELTVAEIRAWLRDCESDTSELLGDVVGSVLFDELALSELRRMVVEDDASLDELTPSQLRTVIAAARELNPDFFALRDRVVTAGRVALQGAQTLEGDPGVPSS